VELAGQEKVRMGGGKSLQVKVHELLSCIRNRRKTWSPEFKPSSTKGEKTIKEIEGSKVRVSRAVNRWSTCLIQVPNSWTRIMWL
jgi:hypothetical protein